MRLFAYLDPGSASALLAAVLAGVAGIGAALRTFGKNFVDKLMFWKKSEPDDGAEDEAGQAEGEAAEAAADESLKTPAKPSDAGGSSGR